MGETLIKNIIKAAAEWRKAGDNLGFRVTAPFVVDEVTFVAFIPDFGGPNGTLVALYPINDPGQEEAWKACAMRHGLFLSQVNHGPATQLQEADVIDALEDWAYFGPPDHQPIWFVKR